MPAHKHVPYLLATSNDMAHSWNLTVGPLQLLSARPRALVLVNGALLLSGGRPGLSLWASADGFGKTWEKYDIPAEHNKLINKPDHKFCDTFVNASMHPYTVHGAQSSAYTAIVPLANEYGLVCYGKSYGSGDGKACEVKGSQVFCLRFRAAAT